MNISKRISELMVKNKMTQYKLSKISNVGQSTLSGIINDGRVPSIETLKKICDAFGISLSTFFLDEEENKVRILEESSLLSKFNSASEDVKKIVLYSLSLNDNNHIDEYFFAEYPDQSAHLIIEDVIDNDLKEILIPVVGKAAAGHPIEMIENGDYFSSCNSKYKIGDFAVIAVGNSMIDIGIHDGDRVLIRPQSQVNDGDVALVGVGEDSTIKRIYRNNDRITLKAENPDFSDLIYDKYSGVVVRILGKFVDVL